MAQPPQEVTGQRRRGAARPRFSEATPAAAPVLLTIYTTAAGAGGGAGSRLVATLHTTLDRPLAEVRQQLVLLAASGRHGAATAGGTGASRPAQPPVNVSREQLAAVLSARLHPFDVTAPFRFVRSGGARSIPRSREPVARVVDVIPQVPSLGLPQHASFSFTPAPGRVVISRRHHHRHSSSSSGGPNDDGPATTMLREALVAVFVAPGDFSDEAPCDTVVAERLLMSIDSFGRPPPGPAQLAPLLTKWNANVADLIGRTVLQELAQVGAVRAVSFLLSQPFVSVDEPDNRGDTALHLAVARGHLEVVAALLDAEASPLQRNVHGETPLHVALQRRQDTVLALLCRNLRARGISAEALHDHRDAHGRNPIDLFLLLAPSFLQLCHDGRLDALRALQGHFLFPRDEARRRGQCTGETPLHEAASQGHAEVVDFLLTESLSSVATEECRDWLHRTPLHLAAARGHALVVQLLLRMRMDAGAVDKSGRTALHAALYARHWGVAELLLHDAASSALDVNGLDSLGHSPLHLAAAAGNTRLVGILLIEHRAQIDLRSVDVVTQLVRAPPQLPHLRDHYAFLRHRRAVNSRYRRPTGQGRRRRHHRRDAPPPPPEKVEVVVAHASPLWAALHAERGVGIGAAAALLEAGAGRGEHDTAPVLRRLIMRALSLSAFECAAALVKVAGASLAADHALLTHFCTTGDEVAVRWLVERGICDGSHGAASGPTPIAAAAAAGHGRIVRYLLAHGATPNCSSGTDTPLLRAIAGGHHDVVHALVVGGARVAPSDGGYRAAPLVAAARGGQEQIVRALLGIRGGAAAAEASTAVWAALVAGAVATADARGATTTGGPHERCAVAIVESGAVLHEGPVHPCEVLHLAAAKGYFAVVRAVCGSLVRLPADILRGVFDAAPLPEVRETRTLPPQREKKRRGRAHLHPARRHEVVWVVPRGGLTRSSTAGDDGGELPLHRRELRDVASYLAAAPQERETLTTLLLELGLTPWAGPDATGRTAADYALQRGSLDTLTMLAACGVLPIAAVTSRTTATHAARGGIVGVRNRRPARGPHVGLLAFWQAAATVRRAALSAKGGAGHHHGGGDALPHALLLELARRGEARALLSVLESLMRRHRVTSLAGAGRWSRRLLSAAAALPAPELQRTLIVDLRADAALPLKDDGVVAPLVHALLRSDFDLTMLLLRHGARADSPTSLDRAAAAALAAELPPSVFDRALPVTPLFVAAARGDLTLTRLLLAHGADAAAAPTGSNADAMAAAVHGAAQRARKVKGSGAAATVGPGVGTSLSPLIAALANANAPLSDPTALVAAARAGLHDAVMALTDTYGERALAAALRTDQSLLLHLARSAPLEDMLLHALTDRTTFADFSAALKEGASARAALTVVVPSSCSVRVAAALAVVGVRVRHANRAISAPPRRPPHLTASASNGAAAVRQLSRCSAEVRRGRHENIVCAAASNGAVELLRLLAETLPRPVVEELAETKGMGSESLLTLALAANPNPRPCVQALLQLYPRPRIPPASALGALACVLHAATAAAPTRRSTQRRLDWIELFASSGGDVAAPIDLHAAPAVTLLAKLGLLRRVLFVGNGGVTMQVITPLTLAALLGSVDAVTGLLAHGARAACALSVARLAAATWRALPEARGRRRGRGSPMGGAASCVAAPRALPVPFLYEVSDTTGGKGGTAGVGAALVVTPLLAAFAALQIATATAAAAAAAGDRAAALRGELDVAHALLRAGGMRAEDVSILCSIAARLQQPQLLSAILDEACRLQQHRRGGGGDRFLERHPLADDATAAADSSSSGSSGGAPLIIRFALGPARHPLHAAISSGCTREELVRIVRHSVRDDVEGCVDARGCTAMYHAARRRDTVALELLLSLRVPADAVCEVPTRRTPLMIAARFGRLEAASLLLGRSNIDAADSAGNTALMHAVAAGCQEIAEMLLSVNAKCTIVNGAGHTAPMIAALRGHDQLAGPLLQHWTPLALLRSATTTVLHCAAVGGCVRAVEHILASHEEFKVLEPDGHGHSAVYLAWAFGRTAVLRALLSTLQHRPETPRSDVDGQILDNSSTICRYGLLRDTLALAASLAGGGTAVGVSSSRSALGAPRLALRPGELMYGASVPPLGSCASPLLWFARGNCLVGVRACADHNVVDDCYALHAAAAAGHADVARLLLSLDMSDAMAVDPRGRRALDCALECGREVLALLLLERMPLTPEMLAAVDDTSGQALLHRVASSHCPGVVGALLARTGAGASPSPSPDLAGALLSQLLAEDRQRLTPFEIALLVGDAAMALRIAAAVQQLAGAAGRQVSIPISASLFESVPCISPAVRTLLYDFFSFTEVGGLVGFEPRASPIAAAAFGRLSFPDVRLLGIEALRADRVCAPRCAEVFSVEHERAAFQQLVPALELRHRVKLRFDAMRHISPQQQAAVLQRLPTALLLGRYGAVSATLGENNAPPLTIELELVRSRGDVRVVVEGGVVRDCFAFIPAKGLMVTADAAAAIRSACGQGAAEAKRACDDAAKAATEVVRGATPHPALRHLRLAVDISAAPASDVAAVAAVACGPRALGAVTDHVLSRARGILGGCTGEQLRAVASTASLAIHSVTIRYDAAADAPAESGGEMPPSGEAEEPELVVRIGTECVADVERALAPLFAVLSRDAAMVRVHLARDALVACALRELGLELKFKLEVEGADVRHLPVDALEEMLSNFADAMRSLLLLSPTPTPRRPGDVDSAVSACAGERVTASSLRHVRAVLVLFSTRRPAAVRREGAKVFLCLTTTLAPSRAEIAAALRDDTAAAEVARLKDALPGQLSDLTQRLNTYLPAASLIIDIPSLAQGGNSGASDDISLLGALALLQHEHSALVLQPLIRGVSVGWDSRLGGVVRRCVKEITVANISGAAAVLPSLALQQDGRLLYGIGLTASHRHALRGPRPTAHPLLLTAEMVASYLLIACEAEHREVRSLVDTQRAFACWCRVGGRALHGVVAGERGCSFLITARNILNAPCTAGGDPFEVSGVALPGGAPLEGVRIRDRGNGTYAVSFDAPTRAGRVSLDARLHGHSLACSPVDVRVAPGRCSVGATRCIAPFDTVVAGRPFVLQLQTRDAHGNRRRATPGPRVTVEGPPAANQDGITVLRCVDANDGTLQVHVVCTVPARSIAIPLRVRDENEAHVVGTTLEVISEDALAQLLKARSGLPIGAAAAAGKRAVGGVSSAKMLKNRAAVYFRRAVREAERQRRERDLEAVGDRRKKRLPPKCPRTWSAYAREVKVLEGEGASQLRRRWK